MRQTCRGRRRAGKRGAALELANNVRYALKRPSVVESLNCSNVPEAGIVPTKRKAAPRRPLQPKCAVSLRGCDPRARFLRRVRKPTKPRPPAKSGSVAGSGVRYNFSPHRSQRVSVVREAQGDLVLIRRRSDRNRRQETVPQ